METEDLQEQFNELMDQFSKGAEGQAVDMPTVFSKCIGLFDAIKLVLATGAPEEKKNALKLMTEMYTALNSKTQAICEKTGLTPDQLTAFTEDSKNFSPQQWELMQDTKNKLKTAGEEVAAAVMESTDLMPKVEHQALKVNQAVGSTFNAKPDSGTPPKKPPASSHQWVQA